MAFRGVMNMSYDEYQRLFKQADQEVRQAHQNGTLQNYISKYISMPKVEERVPLGNAIKIYLAEHVSRVYNSETKPITENDIIVTQEYLSKLSEPTIKTNPQVSVTNETTVEAICRVHKQFPDASIVALNFAGYRNIGGKFLWKDAGVYKSETTQEEMLCHSTDLYANQLAHRDYYIYNNKTMKDVLYDDRMLLSQDITVKEDHNLIPIQPFRISVMTCAAPYLRGKVSNAILDKANKETIPNRIKFIINTLAKIKPNSIAILGAFGCGIFRNNPEIVANCFKQTIKTTNTAQQQIIFAVPHYNENDNYDVFYRIFNQP